MDLKAVTVICGHYGTGKTNLSVNLAADAANAGKNVTLIDMDTVNPYFRSSDHAGMLRGIGVKVISPVFANTNVETMSIPPEMLSSIDDGTVIIDAGGDDTGATILGRFSDAIKSREYDMWYVVNRYRSMVSDAETSAGMLNAIEAASRLSVTGIVNNSHLKEETTAEMIAGSMEYAKRTAELANVPLKFTTCSYDMAEQLSQIGSMYPIRIYVRTPWENEGA